MDRSKLIKLIHVARRELGMDESAYRALLKRITGKDSLTQCSEALMERLLGEMKNKGFKVQPNHPAKSQPVSVSQRQIKDPRDKALSLWLELADYGIVKNPSDLALAKYCSRVTKIDHWHWLNNNACYQVIESLKAWLARELLKKLVVKIGMSTPTLSMTNINTLTASRAQNYINQITDFYGIDDLKVFLMGDKHSEQKEKK